MDAVLQKRVVEAFLTVFCPALMCVGIGLIAHGAGVFTPRSGFFQLGVNGAMVGVLVLIARRCSTERFFAVAMLIALAMAVMTARSGWRIMLHTTILMAMWIGVVFLNVNILGRHRWARALGQHVAWSLVSAVGLFGAGVVLILLFPPSEMTPHLIFYAKLSVLTGVGLGLGLKMQDRLTSRS